MSNGRRPGNRRESGGVAAACAALLLMGAACGDRTPAASAPTAAVASTTPSRAAPPAAGIGSTPQPGSAGASASQAAEATLARIRLFPTDLPPGWAAGEHGINATWAEIAGDTRRARMQASLNSGGQTVYQDVWLFKDAVAARARLEDVTARGPVALREIMQDGGTRSLTGIEEAGTPVEVGEGGRLFRLTAADGQPAGTLVLGVRGAVCFTVIVRGAPDAVALARVLDSRAAAAQR